MNNKIPSLSFSVYMSLIEKIIEQKHKEKFKDQAETRNSNHYLTQ